MPKYSSYPVVTSIVADDVVLIHQDSSNAERLISFTNLEASILNGLPDATTSDPGLMSAADKTKLDDLVQIDSVTSPLTLSLGVLGIQPANDGQSGYMTAPHYTLINTATSGAVPSTLVRRDANSNVLVGGITALASGGGFGGIGGVFMVISGNIESASLTTQIISLTNSGSHIRFYDGIGTHEDLIKADVALIHAATSNNIASALVRRDGSGAVSLGAITCSDITASGLVIPQSFRLSKGVSGLKTIDTELKGTASYTFIGGANTENFTIGIFGPAVFPVKPNWGIVVPIDPHYNATFLVADAGNNTVIAICQILKVDGTNVTAGSKSFYFDFAYLTA